MWNTTLMILHADNGGYTRALGPCSDGTDPVKGVTCMTGEAGANNYPLRGGKYSFFEGGIRANSFASGGLLPTAVRGTRLSGLMHVADWYVTYCAFAKIDSADKPGELAGVPPVEGLDMWPLLSGKNMTSPRTEIFFSSQALIVGDWKLLTGSIKSAAWAGPTYPNATSDGNTLDQCKSRILWLTAGRGRQMNEGGAVLGVDDPSRRLPVQLPRHASILLQICLISPPAPIPTRHSPARIPFLLPNPVPRVDTAKCINGGCLYNVAEDRTEHVDLASSNPAMLAKMAQRLAELVPTGKCHSVHPAPAIADLRLC